MLHPSTRKLIDKLGEMTRKQRVAWIEGEDGSVVHDTEGYRVILTPEPHSVLLTDAVGREIETCTPEEISDETDAHGRPYPQFVAELFREAHRHARGAERAIRVLLAGLEAADAEEEDPAPAPLEAGTAEVPEGGASDTPEPVPETLTDETARLEGETAITAAVASLADQINNAPEPVPQMTPGPQPVRPAPAGVLQQRFSLSGIPYTAGAAASAPAQAHTAPPDTAPPETGSAEPGPDEAGQARRILIDATDDDLGEPAAGQAAADSMAPPAPGAEPHIPTPAPTRLNPWD